MYTTEVDPKTYEPNEVKFNFCNPAHYRKLIDFSLI